MKQTLLLASMILLAGCTTKQQGMDWAERNVLRRRQVLNHLTDDEFMLAVVRAEHARTVRICRQARMLKFHGLRDTDTNEWLDGYEAACCDILTALQRGRGGKG